jgi:hypothetical protein
MGLALKANFLLENSRPEINFIKLLLNVNFTKFGIYSVQILSMRLSIGASYTKVVILNSHRGLLL